MRSSQCIPRTKRTRRRLASATTFRHALSPPRSAQSGEPARQPSSCNSCAVPTATVPGMIPSPVLIKRVWACTKPTGAIIAPSPRRWRTAHGGEQAVRPRAASPRASSAARAARWPPLRRCGASRRTGSSHKKTCGEAPASPRPPPPPPPPKRGGRSRRSPKSRRRRSATTASRSRARASTTSATRASSTRRCSACSTRRWCGRTSEGGVPLSAVAAPLPSSRPSRASTRRRRGRRSRRARSSNARRAPAVSMGDSTTRRSSC